MLALDRAHSTAGLSGSPFVLTFRDGDNGPVTTWRQHTPDFFVRLANGSVLVVDCRGPGVVPRRLSVGQAAMKRAAAAVGWEHEIRSPLSLGLARNLRWLAGYRHPRFARLAASHRASTRSLLPRPRALLDTATLLGDPVTTLPVLFHLVWTGAVATNLEIPLGPQSRISWKGQR
jgi:hypothetical protein